ncbi:hypothetical protein CCP2SC5_740019 [Azospirillaceae bacterium]
MSNENATASAAIPPANKFTVTLTGGASFALVERHGVINTQDKATMVPSKDGSKLVPAKVQIPYDYYEIEAPTPKQKLGIINAIKEEQDRAHAGLYEAFVAGLEEKLLEDANDKAWKQETVNGVTRHVVDPVKFAELLKNPPQKASNSLTVMKKEQGELGLRMGHLNVAMRLTGATPAETEKKQGEAAAALGLAATPAALVTALGAAVARFLDLTARIAEADKKKASRAATAPKA